MPIFLHFAAFSAVLPYYSQRCSFALGDGWVLVGPAAFKAVVRRAERLGCVRFARISAKETTSVRASRGCGRFFRCKRYGYIARQRAPGCYAPEFERNASFVLRQFPRPLSRCPISTPFNHLFSSLSEEGTVCILIETYTRSIEVHFDYNRLSFIRDSHIEPNHSEMVKASVHGQTNLLGSVKPREHCATETW